MDYLNILVNRDSRAVDYEKLINTLIKDFNHLKDLISDGKLEFSDLTNLDPFSSGILIVLSLAIICFIMSIITKNYSQVDRLWSLLPIYFTFHFSILHYKTMEEIPPRSFIMLFLVIIWGMRLTFNFWRKGGYSLKEEDYRWRYVKKAVNNEFLWILFNIFFICLFQLSLLFAITLPAYVAFNSDNFISLTILDIIAVFLFFVFLCIEIIADEQQWDFQTKKYQLINENKPREGDYKLGFITHGLYAYSRHPNFFAEMSLWWIFYLFSVSSSGVWLNYSIIGTAFLTLLFQGSTRLTENISKRKYPEYAIYQKTTSRFIPWFRGPPIVPSVNKKK